MKRSALIAAATCFLFAGTAPNHAQPVGAPPSPVGAGVLCNTCYTPLAASTTSFAIAIPAASPPYNALTLKNTGAFDAYFTQGNSTITALLTSPILRAGACITVLVNGGFLAAITASGTTNIDVYQSNASVLLQCNNTSVTVTGTPVGSTQSAATENSHVFCTAACTVYSLGWPDCPTGDWAMLFDGTSAPADGAVTPAWYFPIGNGLTAVWTPPRPMTNGAVTVCSSTGPYTKTTVAASFIGQAR